MCNYRWIALFWLGLATQVQAMPATTQIEGALTSAGGGPVADGKYSATFSYVDAKGAALWSEADVVLDVSSGRFAAQLGTKVAILPGIFANATQLVMAVGGDPPLPGAALAAVPTALRAKVAEGVDCSGCVTAAMLDPALLQDYAKTKDLSGYAKAADLSNYLKAGDLTDYVKASSLAKVAGSGSFADLADAPKLAKVATSGSYADLNSLPVLAKIGSSCGTGLVMKGIKADGSYDCASLALSAAGLPKDGLDEVSNGTLTNQFNEVANSSKTPIDIADAFPAGTSDEIVVPDYGLAENVSIALELLNSDLSKVKVTVYDPQGKPYVLHNQSGSGTSLKGVWPSTIPLVSGDLTEWVGGNPKGKWSISVADLVGTGGGKDGKLVSWAIQVQTLSSQKVEAKGALLASGGFRFPIADGAPFTCDAAHFGYAYLDAKSQALLICRSSGSLYAWSPFDSFCGNGKVESGEECDDGTGNANSAGKCRLTCAKPKCGDKIVDANESCDDGNTADGDGCAANCQPPCTNGWVYKGICLRSAAITSNADNVPAGCNVYQPAVAWNQSDFIAICQQFGPGVGCGSPDTDSDGGKCNNYAALLSFEQNSGPDVWVHSSSFTWSSTASTPSCNLKSDAATTGVYACK